MLKFSVGKCETSSRKKKKNETEDHIEKLLGQILSDGLIPWFGSGSYKSKWETQTENSSAKCVLLHSLR